MKWLLLCSVLLLGLSACDGSADSADPVSTFTPTSTALDTPSSSAPPTGPVEPKLPAAAKAPTKAGADAFIRYYFEEVSYGLVTGETQGLRRLNGPSCAGCEGGASFIERIYRKGGSVSAGPYRIRSISIRELTNSTSTPVFNGTVITRSTRQVIRVPGEKTQQVVPTTERYGVTVTFSRNAWQLDVLGKLK